MVAGTGPVPRSGARRPRWRRRPLAGKVPLTEEWKGPPSSCPHRTAATAERAAVAVSKSTRFAVLLRDNFTCRYCGARPPAVTLQIEHVIPRSRGGTDAASNLAAACEDCNQGKSARMLPTDIIARLTGRDDPAIARGRAADLAGELLGYLEDDERGRLLAEVRGTFPELELSDDAVAVYALGSPPGDAEEAPVLCAARVADTTTPR